MAINEEEVAWKFQIGLSSFPPLPGKCFDILQKAMVGGGAEEFLTEKGNNFHFCQLPWWMKEYYLIFIFSLIQGLGSIIEKKKLIFMFYKYIHQVIEKKIKSLWGKRSLGKFSDKYLL